MTLIPPDIKRHFSRFLGAEPGRLHVAAHSHHPWPDVSLDAHHRAWLDAAELMDEKWDRILGEVVPAAREAVADVLGLPDPATLVFAPTTHELVTRVLSCLPRPTRILTTGAEFHSFARQARRLEEEGLAAVERVPARPFATFPERVAGAAAAGGHHLVLLSHVQFDSGYLVPDLGDVVAAVPDEDTVVLIDGYHGFMALPTDLSGIADRAFYVAGGYKYAMAGEGACFMHAPPGWCPRPVDTGWFAAFGHLTEEQDHDRVPYAAGGARFRGATLDATGIYRLLAVQRWLAEIGVDAGTIHAHVGDLQQRFLTLLDDLGDERLGRNSLLPSEDAVGDRGNFLTFVTDEADAIDAALAGERVIVDHRGDRLRFGFGVYHDADDLDVLVTRLAAALADLA